MSSYRVTCCCGPIKQRYLTYIWCHITTSNGWQLAICPSLLFHKFVLTEIILFYLLQLQYPHLLGQYEYCHGRADWKQRKMTKWNYINQTMNWMLWIILKKLMVHWNTNPLNINCIQAFLNADDIDDITHKQSNINPKSAPQYTCICVLYRNYLFELR